MLGSCSAQANRLCSQIGSIVDIWGLSHDAGAVTPVGLSTALVPTGNDPSRDAVLAVRRWSTLVDAVLGDDLGGQGDQAGGQEEPPQAIP